MSTSPIRSMSVADIQRLFSEDGFLYIEDADIGDRVKAIRKDGFPIETMGGLNFCKENVLDNECIRHVLEALFPWSGLGIYEVYRPDSGHNYAFMTGLNHEMKAVVVQLWSPQSSMLLYSGSQHLPIKGCWASNGLLEIPSAALRNCNSVDVNLKGGGIAIFDARLSFRNLTGFAMYFVFATKEELKTWGKRKFPKDQDLAQKASQMESPKIGLNFAFEGR